MRRWLPFPSCGSRPPRPQSCLGFACTAPRPARPCPRAAAQPQLPPGTHSETLHLSSFIQPASLASQLSRQVFRSERRCDKCEEDEPPAAEACLSGHRRCRQGCKREIAKKKHPPLKSCCQSAMNASCSSIHHKIKTLF